MCKERRGEPHGAREKVSKLSTKRGGGHKKREGKEKKDKQ
jgi:hypothetical protein